MKIGELFTLQMGKTPSRDNLSYWNGTNKWCSIADLSNCEKYIIGTKECITDRAIEESGIKPVPPNTVIMSFKLSIGKTAITKEPIYTNEAIMAFVSNGKIAVDPDYLYHYFSNKNWMADTNKAVMGATLNKATISEMTIALPHIDGQKEIANKLDKIDGIIALRKKQLQKLDDLVKARFVEMFGECEELVPAGTIMSEMRNGISPSTSGQHHERVLTLSAITQGRFDPNMWKDGVFDTEPPTEKRISADDFYMCRGNGNKSLVGVGVYSSEDRRDLVFPDTVIAARVDTARVCLPYLFVAWMQPDVRNQIETGARTTNGTYKINQQVISKIKIPLPPLAQQKQFAAFVSQVDKSKLSIQQGLEKLETLKQSLMQQYFGQE